MKIQNLFFLALAFVAFGIQGCKKDDKSFKEVLLASKWKVTAHTASPAYDYDGDGIVDPDIYAVEDACSKDDTYDFGETTVVMDEGATLCSPGDPQTSSLPYTLSADEKTIILFSSYTVKSYNENSFTISGVNPFEPTVTETLTFTAQ